LREGGTGNDACQPGNVEVLPTLARVHLNKDDPVAAPRVRGSLAPAYGLAGGETDARAALALDLSPAEIEENIRGYSALRRMIAKGKPVGALVFG